MKNLEQFPNTSNPNNETEKPDLRDDFPDLYFKSEVKDFENIDQIAQWFKKEVEKSLDYDNPNKPTGTVESLALFLAKQHGKDIKKIKDITNSFIEATNEHIEYWLFDEKIEDIEAYEKENENRFGNENDYKYTHGDVNWMKEHIYEYKYYMDDSPGSFEPHIHKWDDDGLQKAIQKWLEFIKSQPNNDENKE